MSKLRTLALVGVLAASMLAPTRADDDDIQVPNVLNAPPASAVIAYTEPVIAITHVRVVDGTGAAAREDQTVLIDHGKIRAFGPASATGVPNGAKVIDGSGETLTPGFVGTHDHLYFVSGGPLFTHQLSHLWVDFRNIRDAFMREHGSDYFENTRQATYAQQAYAVRNPMQWRGYGEW